MSAVAILVRNISATYGKFLLGAK